MRLVLCEFWKDERGSLLVTEWVFLATILVMGILPTAVSVRNRLHQATVQTGPGICDYQLGRSYDAPAHLGGERRN